MLKNKFYVKGRVITMTELKKMSKKAQRAYHAQQRGSWYGVNPVTKIVPNKGKNAYNRQAAKKEARCAL